MAENIKDSVKAFYGKKIQKTDDLEIDLCVLNSKKLPAYVKQALSEIHNEVSSKYYGCGIVMPDHLEGMSILDLGSGAGQDCFVLSKLVGESGSVTGVDMTDELLETANKYIDYHTKKFGYTKPNVRFVKGYVEKLREAGLEDHSVDIVISNCVICLVPDKRSVLQEAYRVLKNGGELYFSDLFVNKDVPQQLKDDEVLWGEGLSGAWRWEELVTFCEDIGFTKPRIVSTKPFQLRSERSKQLLGDNQYISAVYRLFKLPSEKKETVSQVTYNGDILGAEKEFKLDRQWNFKIDEPVTVPDEVSNILQSSRFKKFFTFHSDVTNEAISQDAATEDPFVVDTIPQGRCA